MDLESHREPLRRFAARRVGDVEADDVVQETFARAIRALPTFRGGSSLSTWLHGVARNVCGEALRRRRPAVELDPARADGAPPPERALIAREALDSLPAAQRQALELQGEGYTYREIADRLGVPLGTVRSRLHNAKAALSRRLLMLTLALAMVGTVLAVDSLERAIKLNQTGRWDEAAKAAASEFEGEKRCEAVTSAAYASVRLGREQEARRLIERFDADSKCRGLRGSYVTAEIEELRKTLRPGTGDWTLQQAFLMARESRRAGAERAARRALALELSERDRCQAYGLLIQLGVASAVARRDQHCARLPTHFWARRAALPKWYKRKR